MNVKSFFVDALQSALDLGIATSDDVVRHVTPDLLAQHLPRPLWARLITACVGASRVDSQLVIETIGLSNLCEHIPSPTIWSCIAEIGQLSLGGEVTARPAAAAPQAPAILTRPAAAKPLSISGPPPPDPIKPAPAAPPLMAGPSIPAPSAAYADAGDLDDDRTTGPARPRTATGSRFRATSTNISRLGSSASQRRPQAAAPSPTPPAADPVNDRPTRTILPVRRGQTEVEVEVEVESGNGDWRSSLAVEDEQLVDWSAADETVTGEDPDARIKR